MTRFTDLVQAIQTRSNDNNKGVTFISSDAEEIFVTYKELYEKAVGILGYLNLRGLKAGDELILQIDDNKDYIFMFWACLLGKIIPVPVTVGNNEEHRRKLFRIIDILCNPYIVTTKKTFNALESFAQQNELSESMLSIKNKALFTDELQSIASGNVLRPQENDIAFIQFSSGSTGDPKGVVLTHSNLLSNIYASIRCSGTGPEDSMLSWMPLTHDMGMIGFHLLPLVAGINQYIIPTSLFIRRPSLWLKKSYEHKINILSSPNFGYRYLLSFYKPDNFKDWDLSHIKIIYNGAEPISAELCREFLEKMNEHGLQKTAIFPVYGLAEASVAATFSIPGEEFIEVNIDRRYLNIGDKIIKADKSDINCVTLVSVGFPVDDCNLRICDEEDNVLQECSVGQIQIKGKNVTAGYYRNQVATDNALTRDGWLKTGDLGFLNDGRLVVTGRIKDIIFINGQNYYPHDIERIAEKVEGVEFGGVAACGIYNEEQQKEDVVIFTVFKGKNEDFVEILLNVKKLIGRQIGIEVRNVIPIRKLPKTTSGKIQRYKLSKEYTDGCFEAVISQLKQLVDKAIKDVKVDVPVNEIEENLIKIWSGVLKLESIGVNDNFFEIGGNSSLMVQMLSQIEADYPGAINVTDPFETPTVRGLAQHIYKTVFKQESTSSIKTLELPERFFVNTAENYPRNAQQEFSFTLNEESCYKMRNICEREGVQTEDILLLLYAFAISQVSGVRLLDIQSLLNKNQVINNVRVDFTNSFELSDLLREVNRARSDSSVSGVKFEDMVQACINKTQHSIFPLIYSKSSLKANVDLMEVFDMVVRIEDYEDSINVFCEYNAMRLKKEGIEQIVNQYIHIINSLINKY